VLIFFNLSLSFSLSSTFLNLSLLHLSQPLTKPFEPTNSQNNSMIYLKKDPLLRSPEGLTTSHLKSRLLGHFGSAPGQSFTYLHFNRLIKKMNLDAFFISGPGHGAPGIISHAYLEGSYTEVYPEVTQDLKGMQRLFHQFSFPGGMGSHATPEVPGSLHEVRREFILGERESMKRTRRRRS
jgi:phosphoketolase